MTSILRTCCLLILTGLTATVQAGNIYKFRDADGNVLFTNVVNEKKKPRGDDFKQYTTLEKVTWFSDTNVHRYGNWGDSEFAVRPSFSKNRNAFDDLIMAASQSHNVDHGLVKAIIHTESGFNPKARSKPGAQGLMQLMPATAGMYGVVNAYDPAENIEA
ncbi:MAG: transglycosylase SLT domain-containing protein, partial [Moraxellaceae bacterium]|nr:transglycosylase SLT domain-containing protein [Moraxellaceae bacterium]